MSDELPVEFNEGAQTSVEVKLDAKAQRKKDRLEMLAMYPELGSKVLKVNAKALASIGKQIELLGVKKIGLGSLAASNEAAITNLIKCDEYAKKLEADGATPCPDSMIAILQLQKQFGDQLIEVAKTYLNVDKLTGNGNSDKPMSLAFPSGTQMVVAVNSKKVESVDKQLPE